MLLPVRLLLALLVNVLLLPRNLIRLVARRPAWISLRLDGKVPERPPRRRFPFRRPRGVSVAGLVELARVAGSDPRVRGVVLEIDDLDLGWARVESLRAVVASLRAAGKRVVAHLSSPGNKAFYLAAACDEIFADASGPIGLTGVAAEAGFYGEALRRAGIDPQLDHLGEYKSFAETFTRADMSPAHREALEAILDGIDRRLLGAIAASRRVDEARARALVDGGPYQAEAAREAGLLDGVLYRDELPARLGASERPARIVPARRWIAARPRWVAFRRPRRAVAVLGLEGMITPGEGSSPLVAACGAEPAVRALSSLREDPRVAAVVLHVDSRGGSAAASDRIWREVARLVAAKPVVAFLGDTAASGGYYVAAPATTIIAQPLTLTGSIGVVAGKFSVERLLERVGVGTAILARGRAAAMHSPRRRFDDDERARLRAELEATYRQFLDRVAAGRKISVERADEVGRGRVWTGEDAAARGLVDRLGSLADAVAAAEERARRRPGERLAVVDVPLHPRRSGLLSALTSDLAGALAPLRLLARERTLLLAADLPEIV